MIRLIQHLVGVYTYRKLFAVSAALMMTATVLFAALSFSPLSTHASDHFSVDFTVTFNDDGTIEFQMTEPSASDMQSDEYSYGINWDLNGDGDFNRYGSHSVYEPKEIGFEPGQTYQTTLLVCRTPVDANKVDLVNGCKRDADFSVYTTKPVVAPAETDDQDDQEGDFPVDFSVTHVDDRVELQVTEPLPFNGNYTFVWDLGVENTDFDQGSFIKDLSSNEVIDPGNEYDVRLKVTDLVNGEEGFKTTTVSVPLPEEDGGDPGSGDDGTGGGGSGDGGNISGQGAGTNGLVPCGNDHGDDGAVSDMCKYEHLIMLIQNIINYIIVLAASIAALMFMYAGVLYLTARGDQNQIKKAHGIFGKVIGGFIVILLAWLIVESLVSLLVTDEFRETLPLDES